MLEGVAEPHWGFETMFAFIYDTHCTWCLSMDTNKCSYRVKPLHN